MLLSRGGERRRALSPTVVAAGLIAVALVASAVVFYPLLSGGEGVTTGISRTPTNGTGYATTATTLPPATSYPSTAPPATNSTSSWQEWQVANVTLGSPGVQAYIQDAYNYSFFIAQTGASPVLVSNVINVIGIQVVSGNWSTQYTITYSHISILNVTVQYTPPGGYQIIHIGVQNYTDVLSAINFTSADRQAIAWAATNSTIKSYLAANPSYVAGAYLFPSGNKTFGGDYLVTFDQLNGTKMLGVFVNPANWQVVAAYPGSRIWSQCYGNGACYYSPWGAAP
jgi:hypothetical protein